VFVFFSLFFKFIFELFRVAIFINGLLKSRGSRVVKTLKGEFIPTALRKGLVIGEKNIENLHDSLVGLCSINLEHQVI
jgi:hypothetical protein